MFIKNFFTIKYILQFIRPFQNINYKKNLIESKKSVEETLSGTLAIDLGNTNTVIAFQDQKDINSVKGNSGYHISRVILLRFVQEPQNLKIISARK